MSTLEKIKSLIVATLIMLAGLFIFKFIPIGIWGKDILFDASFHLTAAIFILYFLWYFIDQNKNWRMPYIVFSGVVIGIISVQRILVSAHNDAGLLIGLLISAVAIVVSRWDYFKGKIDF